MTPNLSLHPPPAPRRPSIPFLRAQWLENSAEVGVDAPLDACYAMWEDRARIPAWMPWITSVEVGREGGDGRERERRRNRIRGGGEEKGRRSAPTHVPPSLPPRSSPTTTACPAGSSPPTPLAGRGPSPGSPKTSRRRPARRFTGARSPGRPGGRSGRRSTSPTVAPFGSTRKGGGRRVARSSSPSRTSARTRSRPLRPRSPRSSSPFWRRTSNGLKMWPRPRRGRAAGEKGGEGRRRD